MPKFTIHIEVKNTGTIPVTAHVGASLVGVNDYKEFFNTSEDYKYTFKVGTNYIVRYLTSNLGAIQKYNLHVALWEAEKPIGRGIKYASAVRTYAVEKKRKKVVMLSMSIPSYYPSSFLSV